MAQPVIGLSVEGYDLRLLWVQGQEVVRWVSRSLDPSLISDGMVVDTAAFGAKVRAVLAEYEIPQGKVMAGFHDPAAVARYLTLPVMGGDRLRSAVDREMMKDTSLRSVDYRYFHQVVERRQAEMTVYALAVRHQALRRYVDALRLAGLAPHVVEFASHALIRAVQTPDVMIANGEATALEIIMVRDDLPNVMRIAKLDDTDPVAVQERLLAELESAIAFDANRQPRSLYQDVPIALTGALLDGREMADAVQAKLGLHQVSLACPFTAPAGFALANYVVSLGLVLNPR